VKLALAEIARYMRMGREVPEGELAARVEKMLAEAERTFDCRRRFRRFRFADLGFESSKLERHLGGCEEVYLSCGTIGAAFDALLRRASAVSGLDALIVQAIGAAAVEKFMDSVDDEIRAELAPGETLLSRYSPGYGDFPLAASGKILELLDAPRRIGVSLTENLLLVPSKTVTAVIGVAGLEIRDRESGISKR